MRIVIAVIATAAAFSQPAPTEFDVASVRPNTANDRIVTINVGPGGRFACRGYTLGLLMQRAYGVMDWNVTQSSKEMSGYALIVGKNGSKLQASADGEEHADTFRLNQTGMKGQGITMANLARYVGGKLGLVVVDQTGLNGAYDFNVEWTVEMDQDSATDLRAALRPAVFAALQDRLGLKLVAQKVPVQSS